MNELTCNYAIARFRPYRETGEFINVGVVLLCPQIGFFNYCFEKRRYKRITDFFPELELEIFKAGLGGLLKELGRLAENNLKSPGQFMLGVEVKDRLAAFSELVRPREAIFHFSEVGSVLASDPKAKLNELFKFYIERQFARDRDYQEIIMRRKLADFLEEYKLSKFYKQDQRIGDDNFHVNLPFVHFSDGIPLRAIKPLHLDKDTPTEIYRHGDTWISSVRRLRAASRIPKDLLFTIKQPMRNERCRNAAMEICNELEKLDVQTTSFSNREAILKFAKI